MSDLPLLDVARQRLGLEPVGELTAAERAQRRIAAEATVEDLIASAEQGSALQLLLGNASSADAPAWTSADLLDPADGSSTAGSASRCSATSSSTRRRT